LQLSVRAVCEVVVNDVVSNIPSCLENLTSKKVRQSEVCYRGS